MKKIVFTILLLSSLQVQAQKAKIFTLGVHAGVNVNTLSTSLPDYFSNVNIGFRGGLFTRINIKRFHIQPELNFSMVGSDGTFSENPNRYYSTKTNTLEVPLLFGFKIIDFKLINLRLQAGGFFAWNITNTIKVQDAAFPINDSTITSYNGAKFNGGIILGAGVDVWRFTADFRYQWGLANMYGDNFIFQDPRAGFKYGSFAITIGYKFF
jgi:hypothetical protein